VLSLCTTCTPLCSLNEEQTNRSHSAMSVDFWRAKKIAKEQCGWQLGRWEEVGVNSELVAKTLR